MSATIANPSPVPSPCGFVVKKGSMARRLTTSDMPGPVSSTQSTTVRSSSA